MLRRQLNLLGAALALALVSLAAACSSTGETGGSAELRVTADFGAELLADETIPAGPSVLAALQDLTDVDTGFGGGFVEAMYGRASSGDPQADWFYFIDGRLAETGARGRPIPANAHIWWDHRRWSGANEVRAVVGAWPAPFVAEGREVNADPELAGTLDAAGAVLVSDASPWRVLVGTDEDLRARDSAWRDAADDPAAAGIAATISDGQVRILGADGEMRAVSGGRAIAVAVPGGLREEDGLSLIVAGTDAAAARGAAASIADDPAVLAGRFAVGFDGSGGVVAEAGRP